MLFLHPTITNMPPACFLNGLSNPLSPSKNDTTLSNGVVFWRSSRDSNPGGTFMPYEISSHASSTSLSTAPYLQRGYYNKTPVKMQGLPVLLFCNFHNILHFRHHHLVILPSVRNQATGAILDAAFRIGKVAAALIAQRV